MPNVYTASNRYRELRREVSRLASMANKRLDRLERNAYQQLPAYQAWERNGAVRFSVRGKTNVEVQREYYRVKNFLDDVTSTVKGANNFLKQMAQNTGIQYNGIQDLKAKATQFFRLADLIKEYLNSLGRHAAALDYQAIWSDINVFIEESETDLAGIENSEDVLSRYIQYMERLQPVEENQEGFSLNNEDFEFLDF